MPPSHASAACRMMRMSRSAVGDAGTSTATSILGESSALRPTLAW